MHDDIASLLLPQKKEVVISQNLLQLLLLLSDVLYKSYNNWLLVYQVNRAYKK